MIKTVLNDVVVTVEGKEYTIPFLVAEFRFTKSKLGETLAEVDRLLLENTTLKDIWVNLESIRLKEEE